MRADHANEVRSALCDPRKLCEALGWLEGAKREARGVMIRCPSHGERNPSCSVTTGPDGTVRVRCFGCGWTGDALTMVALGFGLSLRNDFREVLATGAELAGHHALASEIRDGAARPERQRVAAPAPQPEPEYPPREEVEELWRATGSVDRDGRAVRMLLVRRIDFTVLARLGIARVIPERCRLPKWAVYGSRSWIETGHTLLLPAFNAKGELRSVRAWRVVENDTPKRLPPRACKAAELVQANRLAVQALRGTVCPLRLYIVEGEPDFLTAATTFGIDDAVIGIGSGSWTQEFADRLAPERLRRATEIFVATHADEAGDRYAAHVLETLGDRCPTWRWRVAA